MVNIGVCENGLNNTSFVDAGIVHYQNAALMGQAQIQVITHVHL